MYFFEMRREEAPHCLLIQDGAQLYDRSARPRAVEWAAQGRACSGTKHWKLPVPPVPRVWGASYLDGRDGFAPEALFSCSRSLSEAASAPLTSSLVRSARSRQ